MKAEIMKFVVDKHETRAPATNYELLDLHQNYDTNKNYLTTIGGQLQQMYYVISSIMELWGDDLSQLY